MVSEEVTLSQYICLTHFRIKLHSILNFCFNILIYAHTALTSESDHLDVFVIIEFIVGYNIGDPIIPLKCLGSCR